MIWLEFAVCAALIAAATIITWALWNKGGLPVMLATCMVASLPYALLYPLFTR